MYKPDLEEYRRHAKTGSRLPLWKEVPLGGLTPWRSLEALGLADSREPVALLESPQKGLTYLGVHPYAYLEVKEGQGYFREGNRILTVESTDALKALLERMNRVERPPWPGLPPFWGGAMGFLSYDLVRRWEQLPRLAEDDLGMPDGAMALFDTVLVFDREGDRLQVVASPLQEEGMTPEEAYAIGKETIEGILERLSLATGIPDSPQEVPLREGMSYGGALPTVPNWQEEEFAAGVRKVQDYIAAGDVFQVNLSVRWEVPFGGSSWSLYKLLSRLNPSPYSSYLRLGEWTVVSSSPELLLSRRGTRLETRPIAGTRKRTGNLQEDRERALKLLNNEKERAEHIMLVDLERNDLGRVCRFGTVQVSELMVLEEYSHVMHIVSHVVGELAAEKGAYDAIQALFPGGTITGAPKIRCMEIIEELEPTRRGLYTGSIGWIGFDGDFTLNIAIRSILIKAGMAYAQAGAGIVIDSIPEREFQESARKAEALLLALELMQEAKG